MGEMENINYLPQTTRKIQEQNMWCLYHPHFIEGEIEQVEKLRFGCCCCSVAKSCPTLCNPMDCSTTGSSFRYFPESAQIHVHWVSVMLAKHLILCCPLLLWPSIFPSLRVFSNESALCIRWPKYWSFSFSISPSNEYSGLISFRIDWFDLLAVHRTLESSPAPQFKSINSSALSPYGPTLTSVHWPCKTRALSLNSWRSYLSDRNEWSKEGSEGKDVLILGWGLAQAKPDNWKDQSGKWNSGVRAGDVGTGR